jgi:uncharacterized protein YqhQ
MNDEEQEKERLNRKLIELLNELSIAIPGVQVLFAFLLIVPFNSGFGEMDDLGRAVSAGSLSCAAVASALLIGPAAYHRHRFRRLEEETASDKKEMIITQDHLAAGGILFLALAMAGSVFMVFDVLFGTVTATIVAGSLVFAYAWFWYTLPVSRRIRSSRSHR